MASKSPLVDVRVNTVGQKKIIIGPTAKESVRKKKIGGKTPEYENSTSSHENFFEIFWENETKYISKLC